MEAACGILKVHFTSNISTEEFMERFDSFLLSQGVVSLTNVHNEYVELDVHEYEIEYLDMEEEEDSGNGTLDAI